MKTRFTWQPYDKEEILNTNKVSTTDGNKTKHNDLQKNAGDKQDKHASKQDTTGNKQGQPVDQQEYIRDDKQGEPVHKPDKPDVKQ